MIDIIRDDLLIEIQTRNFSSIRSKIQHLIPHNRVRIVHPISQLKWIVKVDISKTEEISRRRSPKRGKAIDIFDELIRIPDLMADPNLEIEVLMIESEDIRCDDGKGSWRRRGVSLIDSKLVKVFESVLFKSPEDFLQFIPGEIEKPFTNKSLSETTDFDVYTARMITYCLKKMGAIKEIGKDGNTLLFDF